MVLPHGSRYFGAAPQFNVRDETMVSGAVERRGSLVFGSPRQYSYQGKFTYFGGLSLKPYTHLGGALGEEIWGQHFYFYLVASAVHLPSSVLRLLPAVLCPPCESA